jgi:prophage antirepressor-like protein
MHSAIKAFSYNGKPFRAVMSSPAEPWFFAKDICAVLGLSNISKALENLDSDERGITNEDTLGGAQQVLIVSEPGAYRLIFSSRKPIAKKIMRWLAHEVLPALRKTGRYEARPAAAPALPAANASHKHARRVRYAKLSLVGAAMRLEELGINAAAIDMGAVVAFGRQLARI